MCASRVLYGWLALCAAIGLSRTPAMAAAPAKPDCPGDDSGLTLPSGFWRLLGFKAAIAIGHCQALWSLPPMGWSM